MICSNCQTPNPDDARFCHQCGSPLAVVCPSCGRENVPEAKFCNNCGTRLKAEPAAAAAPGSPPAPTPPRPVDNNLQTRIPQSLADKLNEARDRRTMVGERRVVTILFCDVTGSTAAAGQLDPEEWAQVINQVFEHMIQPVYRYEGIVARLMGDAILAFFGAPIAHEDDPERAVRAGLDIIAGFQPLRQRLARERQIDIGLRVGINTGLVVVGAVGSDLRMEYTALGDAINIAARMEQTAEPSTVQVSEDTYKLVAPLFEFEDLGPMEVKGKSEPIRTYRPVRRKAQPAPTRGIAGLSTPLIGRQREKENLSRAFAGLSRGQGGIVFITGEAGLGKSRLLRELKAMAAKEADPVNGQSGIHWYEAVAHSFNVAQPFAMFRALLRLISHVDSQDEWPVAAQKLAALAAELPAAAQPGVHGAFRSLLGYAAADNQAALDGENFKNQLFATALETIRVKCQQQPGIIVLDDLHWSDPASVELYGHLFRLVDQVPVLFVGAIRPERSAPGWELKSSAADRWPHCFTEIALRPLTAEDSRHLVDNLLTVADLPPTLHQLFQEKSEGNPFFLEEITRMLIEEGVLIKESVGNQVHWRIGRELSSFFVPDNIQSLLTARLDSLDRETRQIVQIAAVIGRTFHHRVLEQVAGSNSLVAALSTLQRREMIVVNTRQPELIYAFRHALVQETAYRSLLRQQRRDYHRQVGEVMASFFAGQEAEYASTLAYHFKLAGMAARALPYFLLAADSAFDLHALKEAINHYGNALELALSADTQVDTPTLTHIFIRLGRANEMAGDYDAALAIYQRLDSLAGERDDDEMRLAALTAQATLYATPTEYMNMETTKVLAQEVLRLAETLGDFKTQAKIYWSVMLAYLFTEDSASALEAGLKSLTIAREHNLREQLAFTLNDINRIHLISGEPDKSKNALEEARELFRELGNKAMLADNLSSSAMSAFAFGRYEEGLAHGREALRISQEIGNPWGQCYSQYTMSFILGEMCELDEALQAMRNALDLVEESGFIVPLIDVKTYMGVLFGFLGAFDRGLTLAREAYDHSVELLPTAIDCGIAGEAVIHWYAGDREKMDAAVARLSDRATFVSLSFFFRPVAVVNSRLMAEDYAGAIAAADENLEYLRASKFEFIPADLLCGKAHAQYKLGQIEAAWETLKQAYDGASGQRRQLLTALPLLARIETERGNQQAANQFRREAKQVVAFIVDHLSDPALRATFLNRPAIRAISEAPVD